MDKKGDTATTSLPTFLIHALDQLLRLKSSVTEAQTLRDGQTKTIDSREFAGRVNKLIVNLKDSINTIERSFTTSYEVFIDTEASAYIVANAKALNHEHSYAQLHPEMAKKTRTISETPTNSETADETPSNSEIADETPPAHSETTTTDTPPTNLETTAETPSANSESTEESATSKTVSRKRINGEVQSQSIESSKTANSDIVSNERSVPVMHDDTGKSDFSSEQQEIKLEMNDSEIDPPKRGFIKCIDITKLLDPTKLLIPKKSAVVNGSRDVNDSVISLSSESDADKKKMPAKKRDSNNSSSKKKQEQVEKQVKKDEHNKSDSDSDVPIAARIRRRNKPNFEQLKKLRQNRLAKKQIHCTSSSSSKSEKSDSESEREKKGSARKAAVKVYDYRSDQKFSQRCTVSLVRVPVEQLKRFCLEQAEEVEVQRLCTMKSLKRTRPDEGSPVETPEEEAVTKARKKRSKLQLAQQSKKKNHQDSDGSEAESTNGLLVEIANEEETVTSNNVEENAKDVLASSDSNNDEHSDHSNKASDTNDIGKKNKKEKRSEKEEEEKKQSDEDDEKNDASDDDQVAEKKGKWKNDPLLKKKLEASASDDSEDELLRFRNKKETLAKEIRRSTRKQLKKVARRLDSDDSSTDQEKDEEKRSSSAELSQAKKSDEEKKSSSESEKEDEDEDKKKPVRKRIKRVKESDESSNGEGEEQEKSADGKDKEDSTRKKIRHVWNKGSLADSTKAAGKEEEARKKRIADRQKMYNDIYVKNLDENAKVDKVVLDFNEESKEELLAVHPDLVAKLKPHQGKGVQFMWTACFESLERSQKTEGSGCILAHCMGLGKTLQVITLIHTLIVNSDKTNVNTVLVVCPLSTVLNWVSEFKMWLDDLDGDQVNVFDLVQYKNVHERYYQMRDWMKHGGVMVMGYDMFRNLSNPKGKRMSKKLVAGFNKVLLEPGPDLVVCDEGHLLKNEKTGISIAMNRLKTKRRIVLTGTPLQNNLKEYFCMVQFVKPSLLGTYKEYLNRFVNPITNGQYTDSTPHDIQIMRRRAHVLHKMLDAVVERRDYNVLAPFLPPKHEYVLFITLTDVQVQLYQEYLTRFARNPQIKGTSYLFQDFQELQRICIHPRVLLDKSNQDKLRKEYEDEESEGSLKDFIDDDESEKSSSSNNGSSSEESDDGDSSIKKKCEKKCAKKCAKKPTTRRTRANPGAEEELIALEDLGPRLGGEWWTKYCENDELENIKYGTKIRLLFEILQQSELIGDKILVFSQSLFSLNLIEYFLARVDEATQKGDSTQLAQCGGNPGSWALGLDYFRLDGSTSCEQRAQWCKTFNSQNNSRARLFLISTRAGGLGINLVAANRVIIFDVSWNPSHDVQSIYRVYRFGQIKPCYVYRFVTYGTMEHKIYERQVTKQAISKRVIDEQQIDRHYNQTDLSELYQFNAVPEEERPVPLVPKDRLFADLLQSHDKEIFQYHEHHSLLENKEEEGLNEEERKAAWEEFENEKTAPKFNLMQTMVRNGMYETLRLLVQQDNNSWTPAQVNQILPSIVQRISEQVARGDYNMYRRVEERHEMRVREQRRTQFIYQQYMQQIRAANATNPMNTAELNRLAQTLSMFAQPQMGQMQPNPYAAQQQPGASSGVSFALDEPPAPAFTAPSEPPPPAFTAPSEPRPHPTISEVVELND